MKRKVASVIALLALLATFAWAPPALAFSTSMNSYIQTNPTTLNADTEWTWESDITNTAATAKNIDLVIDLPVGVYFNQTPGSWDGGTMTCNCLYLRYRKLSMSVPANSTKHFTVFLRVGEGMLSPVFIYSELDEGGNFVESENDSYTRGTGYQVMTWGSSWQGHSFTNGVASQDYTDLQVNYATAHEGTVTFYMDESVYQSISGLYNASTGVQLVPGGSCFSYLSGHGVGCHYTGFVSGLTVRLKFTWVPNGSAGGHFNHQDLLQSTFRDDFMYTGGLTGFLSSDISELVTIN